jgi:hypothetical protein
MPTKKTGRKSAVDVQKLAQASMAAFVSDAEARYKKARRVYEIQDDETQDALDRMTTLLCRIARKNMWVGVGKTAEERVVLTIPEETIYHNMFYMANEILKDLALFDIRVAEYTFPPNLCVECGAEVKPRKKVKS